MKSDRKANLLVFLTIAILALGLSSISAVFTGDLFASSLPGMNSSDKMIALDDDGFSPNAVSTFKEEVEVEDENKTNETVDNSDSNNTENDGGDSDVDENTHKTDDTAKENTQSDANENQGSDESIESVEEE